MQDQDESFSSTPFTFSSRSHTIISRARSVSNIKSDTSRPSGSQSGSMPITVVKASTLAAAQRPDHVREDPSVAEIIYNIFVPLNRYRPLPSLRSWTYVLVCRGEILRTASAMLAELETMSVLTGSFYLPDETIFHAGAVLTCFQALISRSPVLNCRDVACVLYALECYVRRAYSPRSIAAPRLVENNASASVAMVSYGGSSRRLEVEECQSEEYGTSTAASHSPSSPTRLPSGTPSADGRTAHESSYLTNCYHLQLLFTSNINYWGFEVAHRMGFSKLATTFLHKSSRDISPAVDALLDESSIMEAEDKMIVLDYSMMICTALEEWTPSFKARSFGFIEDEELLVNAVCFILNLSAGSLDYNEKNCAMLKKCCLVVKDFTIDYREALENWDLLATTPLGMSPFNVVQEFVLEAVDNIELVKPLWFEKGREHGLFSAVKGLKRGVLAAAAALDKELNNKVEFLDLSWMKSKQENYMLPQLNEDEAAIANIMACLADGYGVAEPAREDESAPAFGFDFAAFNVSADGASPAAGPGNGRAAPAFNFGAAPAFNVAATDGKELCTRACIRL
jgi:hypothetical protein